LSVASAARAGAAGNTLNVIIHMPAIAHFIVSSRGRAAFRILQRVARRLGFQIWTS
jgi:hypothetical protein